MKASLCSRSGALFLSAASNVAVAGVTRKWNDNGPLVKLIVGDFPLSALMSHTTRSSLYAVGNDVLLLDLDLRFLLFADDGTLLDLRS